MKTTPAKLLRHAGSWRPLFCILALAGAFVANAATPPGISNIRAAQRPGTKLVDIQFDLNPVGGGNVPISILVSSNSGGTWDVPARTFVGDHGANIAPGEDKWVVWDAGADWNGQYTANCRVRVMANDPTTGDMVLIPAGSYQRGNVSGDSDILDAPVYSVAVSSFHMDCGEVSGSRWTTVHQWAIAHGYAFDHAGSSKSPSHPVHSTNWYDCVKWCNARSEMEGRVPCYYTDSTQTVVYRTAQVDLTNDSVKWSSNGYRLPTEAEWEKAARGGLAGKRYPWGDLIDQSLANYDNHVVYAVGTMPYTSPVGSFAPNGYGLFDMAGNVFERCWDWWGSAYYTTGQTDPHGPSTGIGRVLRGGSWNFDRKSPRCAWRQSQGSHVSISNDYYGFRCVRGF